ncbi:MAG: glycosyltransferase family 4 protein [Thermoanaerobaculia bacterium]
MIDKSAGGRVVHVTTAHPTFDPRIFLKECRSLATAGYDVTLIAAHGKAETVDGVTIVPIRRRSSRLLRMIVSPWEAMSAATRLKPAIVHCHDPELLPAALIASIRGVQVVYDAHEDAPRAIMSRHYIPKPLRSLVAVALEWFENVAVKYFAAVVAATPAIAARFEKQVPRVAVVNNYPDLSEFPSGAAASSTEKLVRACYVGALSRERGLFDMIEAMRRTRGTLTLAGRWSVEQDMRAIERSPAWSVIDYRGVVSRAEVAAIYSESMVGLVLFHPEPNHIESQPNKLFEYMAAGLPIVGSAFPWWRAIIEKVGCGICVDPLDHEDIARAVDYVFSHPVEARAMGERGRVAVETQFTWLKEAAKLVALYRGLENNRPVLEGADSLSITHVDEGTWK